MADVNSQTTCRVIKISPIIGEHVEFDDNDAHIRYSADNWVWCIGESAETVFNCEELEAAYQKFKGLTND